MGLLSLLKKSDSSYYGSGCYKHVERLLSGEKELLIVSPYVDDYYAEYLLRHSASKNVYILSSSMKSSVARKLNVGSFRDAAVFASVLAFINIALLYLGFFSVYVLLASLFLAVFSLATSLMAGRNIHVKSPRQFIHAKMYISSKSAIEGSANLTYAGMHKNIERINIIEDPEKVKVLRKQFWRMWNGL